MQRAIFAAPHFGRKWPIASFCDKASIGRFRGQTGHRKCLGAPAGANAGPCLRIKPRSWCSIKCWARAPRRHIHSWNSITLPSLSYIPFGWSLVDGQAICRRRLSTNRGKAPPSTASPVHVGDFSPRHGTPHKGIKRSVRFMGRGEPGRENRTEDLAEKVLRSSGNFVRNRSCGLGLRAHIRQHAGTYRFPAENH